MELSNFRRGADNFEYLNPSLWETALYLYIDDSIQIIKHDATGDGTVSLRLNPDPQFTTKLWLPAMEPLLDSIQQHQP